MFRKLFNLFFGVNQEKESKRESYHESLLARIEQQEKSTKRVKGETDRISKELDDQIEQLINLAPSPEMTPTPKRKTKKKNNNT
jgi:hypothetical protein